MTTTTTTTIPTIVPSDESAKGWTQASSWIEFFRHMDEGRQVWMRLLTREDASSDSLEEVDLCGSPEGYFVDPMDGKGGGWLHLMMQRLYPDLRKVLPSESRFLERTARELGLGLK